MHTNWSGSHPDECAEEPCRWVVGLDIQRDFAAAPRRINVTVDNNIMQLQCMYFAYINAYRCLPAPECPTGTEPVDAFVLCSDSTDPCLYTLMQ